MPSRRNIVVAAAAFLLGLAAALVYLREPTRPLTAEGIAEARRLWELAGIDSYRFKYRMLGSLYEVTVRDGLVAELLVNGAIPNAAQPASYSVPGLLDTLQSEFENIHDASRPLGEGGVARVRFHHRLGYPERYIRAGTGVSRGATIEVLEFTPG